MPQTPFHAYYKARLLEQLPEAEQFIPVFASSDIEIYPFQIAAASFALRSPYQKGAVLCDEAGMGKSHEAMLVINQKWLEGCSRILLVIPNADLLHQWTEMLDRFYTVPYVVLTSRKEWQAHSAPDHPNAFIQDAIVVTTYDFAADNEEAAKVVNWDLTVFEEANALSPVYQEDNKQAKALKRIAGDSFKLLLTGTPIEKNIMDLYGLIWFIDETLLPGEKEFLARYLRRPENYPELSEQVSRYCFRTLRSQAKHYAKVTERVLLTVEYTPGKAERQLYELLYAYINQTEKRAFPEMNQYDLALRLLGLLGSSIRYVKLDGQEYYVQEIFDTTELLANLDRNAVKVEHSVYDYVVYDSSTVEKPVAVALDNDPDVKMFFKIPSRFKIETPIGTYNPDWAVYLNKNGEEKLYFVLETKGDTSFMHLKTSEQLKIHCGKEHFKALDAGVELETATSWTELRKRI